MVKLWLWTDTGPSGHGTVGREFVKHLLPHKDEVQLAVYTHQWGMPFKPPKELGMHGFPDERMEKDMLESGRIGKGYLLEKLRDIRYRDKHLLNDVVTMTTENKEQDLMIMDFDEIEDVSMCIGGLDMVKGLPKDSKYKIGETCFNPIRIPDKWLELGDFCDEVWLPNEWNKKVFLAHPDLKYEDKLKVIPYGIEFWEPQKQELVPKLNDDTFTFVCASRWANMKGWDVLLDAFIEEFYKHEKVRLFIKTTLNQQVSLNDGLVAKSIQDLIRKKKIPDPPEIGISTRPYSYQDMFDLYGACDCAVLPHRAEGVGRFQAESMGAGLPLITTDWGGPAEFINKENSLPLKYSEPEQVKKVCEWTWFYKNEFGDDGMLWVEPDKEHLQAQMRKVFEMSKEKRDAIGKKASETVRKHFDWNIHLNTRLNRLKEVSK